MFLSPVVIQKRPRDMTGGPGGQPTPARTGVAQPGFHCGALEKNSSASMNQSPHLSSYQGQNLAYRTGERNSTFHLKGPEITSLQSEKDSVSHLLTWGSRANCLSFLKRGTQCISLSVTDSDDEYQELSLC